MKLSLMNVKYHINEPLRTLIVSNKLNFNNSVRYVIKTQKRNISFIRRIPYDM
ncbi:MAG: hypothetical protein K0S93_130 [Nitrososphaeraceae archaeon]|jgi:hypothetical protein|nr:hypothetical protein [Nitrososphaeraceae archaeon]